jgi:hypothetical protein
MEKFTPGDLGFIPMWCVGGPLDGRAYRDMPVFPGGMPGDRVTMPLADQGTCEHGPTATYIRRPQAEPDGRWFYDFAPTPAQIARLIAYSAHAGQRDKSGEAYISHPRRVAARFDPTQEPTLHAAAWLHDVLEDSATDADALRSHGIPDDVIHLVELLTRRPGVPTAEYYAAIRRNPLATRVKAADIADNLDPTRTARLDPATRERLARKYTDALRALGLDATLEVS